MGGITILLMTDSGQAKVKECGGHQGEGNEASQQHQVSRSSPAPAHHETLLSLGIKLGTNAGSFSMAGGLMQILSQ